MIKYLVTCQFFIFTFSERRYIDIRRTHIRASLRRRIYTANGKQFDLVFVFFHTFVGLHISMHYGTVSARHLWKCANKHVFLRLLFVGLYSSVHLWDCPCIYGTVNNCNVLDFTKVLIVPLYLTLHLWDCTCPCIMGLLVPENCRNLLISMCVFGAVFVRTFVGLCTSVQSVHVFMGLLIIVYL